MNKIGSPMMMATKIQPNPATDLQARELLPANVLNFADKYSRTPVLLPTQSEFAGLLWEDDDL